MKTRINYSEKDDGYSIYDLFARDDLFDKMLRGCKRHFKRDSLYAHALSCLKNNKKPALIECDEAAKYIRMFQSNKEIFREYDFILEQVKIKEGMKKA